MAEIPIADVRRFTPLNIVLYLSILALLASLVIIPLRFLLVPSIVVIILYIVIAVMKVYALK